MKLGDFSKVWKNGGNVIGGKELDLVAHLERHRKMQVWNDAKDRLVEMLVGLVEEEEDIEILDVGCGLGIDLLLMAEAMEKFSFWTQEEIQGYFDQGWSVQQLEEWLENQ